MPRKGVGFFGRFWRRMADSHYATFQAAFDRRDDAVFRKLDFDRFAGYVCDRFLAETGNPSTVTFCASCSAISSRRSARSYCSGWPVRKSATIS